MATFRSSLFRSSLRRGSVATTVLLIALMTLPVTAGSIAAAGAATVSPPGGTLYPSGVGVDLGPTPNVVGLTASAGAGAANLVTGTDGNTSFWQTNAAKGLNSFGFDVTPAYVAGASAPVDVSITYFGADDATLDLGYQGQDGTAKAAPPLQLGHDNAWHTQAVELNDAQFGNTGDTSDLTLSIPANGPDVKVAAVRVSTVGASALLGASVTGNNLSMHPGDPSTGYTTGTVAGKTYWQTDAPSTLFFYGNIADSYLFNTKDALAITVEYYDETGNLTIQYDSPGATIPDMFKPSETITMGGTNTWKTHTFLLSDAIATNRSNGSDFRLAGGSDANIKVHSLSVAPLANTLDPKEGLRGIVASAKVALGLAREGTGDGQYPVGSKATLSSAIDTASGVVGNDAATPEQALTAAVDLYAALRTFTAAQISTDRARGATATASSSATGAEPASATDADATTAWTSAPGDPSPWLQIDLGKPVTINEAAVTWGSAASPDYTIAFSNDGTTFSTVREAGATGAGVQSLGLPQASVRYVRLTAKSFAAGLVSISIASLELRGDTRPSSSPKIIKTVYPTDRPVVADFNVTGYGAKADGTTDDTAAIQSALADCGAAGGGTVWVPDGRYRVTNTLEVPAFCTLQGDHRDPDSTTAPRGATGYGTLFIADVARGTSGPTLFRIGGSAAVVGVTTFYPNQDAKSPIPYNYTFEIPGSAWTGANFMESSVEHVTMLNSYRGIGISTMPNDQGSTPNIGHESATLTDVKGTVLSAGVTGYAGSDVGTWRDITFNSSYWAHAGVSFNAPSVSDITAFTRANGVGFVLGDLEWDQMYNVNLSDFKYGMESVATTAPRGAFTGAIDGATIRNTDIAVKIDSDANFNWATVFSSSDLEGSQYSVLNPGAGYVKLAGTKIVGPTKGSVPVLDEKPTTYTPTTAPSTTRAVLYNATSKDFGAVAGANHEPQQDSTAAIQRALDAAARGGGGVVYLPAGWYRINGHLTVAKNVELRGASPVPNRDQSGLSAGTVLMAHEGRGTVDPDHATALITLTGQVSGVDGLRVFYPENNPNPAVGGMVPYPFMVRALGAHDYVVNVTSSNAWGGVDASSTQANDLYVSKMLGVFVHAGIVIGANKNGHIEGVLSNGNAPYRTGYAVPNWGGDITNDYTRKYSNLVVVNGATNLQILDLFGYGLQRGLSVTSGTVRVVNIGTDNLGDGGYTVAASQPGVQVTNLLRYNGTTSSGPVTITNIMPLHGTQVALTTSVTPGSGGKVTVTGNEYEVGEYEQGAVVSLKAAGAKQGWRFDHWEIDGTAVSSVATVSLTMDAAHAATAVFLQR